MNGQQVLKCYPYKGVINCSWFPRNVEHLCLRGCDDMSLVIDCKRFPKLKHLKLGWYDNSSDDKLMMENLQSVVKNGLKSLCIIFGYVSSLQEVCRSLKMIGSIFELHDGNSDSDSTFANNFILKIDINVYAQSINHHGKEDNCNVNRLSDHVNDVYSLLMKCFSNVMFGVIIKTSFCYSDKNKLWTKYFEKNCINLVQKYNDDTTIVETKVEIAPLLLY